MSWSRIEEIESEIQRLKDDVQDLEKLRDEELKVMRKGHKGMSALIRDLQRLLNEEQTDQVKKDIKKIRKAIRDLQEKHKDRSVNYKY